ncbi:CoA ester lyase [Paraburkholderia sp. B3]|uniref:HpcH/HpaI aldolase/citrate lyase family protein n=1 Tax=Paraburkholderia sp. B3 TaxID=3134791 RepID=UPI003982411A
MTNPVDLRSCLFVPATHPERFGKALRSGADGVIVDLEDAVAPSAKAEAREAVRAWTDAGARALVRVNAPGSAWFDDDMALCDRPGVLGIVLPKVGEPDDLAQASNRLREPRPFFPLIESASGMANVERIAAWPGVARLMFGTVDFAADLDLQGDEEALLYFRSRLVLASRVAGIGAPLDGPSLEFRDAHAMRRASEHARRLGFGGKLCIHPAQVPVVNRAFTPGEEECAWAERIVEGARHGDGVFTVDGQMVDAPVIARAQRILARARRGEASGRRDDAALR